ncbi:MAG: helix-turn-helix transcriptional regulator [Bacillota bacterium]|nr:helix-turn-helix transcriptional regulator [Bacillota bacterium]
MDEQEKLMKDIGKRLRDVIKANGVTQSTFASECGIAYETLRTLLKGNSFYRVDILLTASKKFNVSLDYLLCQEDKPNEKPLREIISEKTNLSEDAVDRLMELGMRRGIGKAYRETIETVIMDSGVLDKLTRYFKFIENKNSYYKSVKDEESWQYAEDVKNSTKDRLNALKQESEVSSELLEMIDIENVLLYQMMKSIDSAVKRKLFSKNSKGR